LKELVAPLYSQCFTAHPGGDPAPLMEALLADDFQSINVSETKGKAQLIGQVQHFWKLIPDLKWEVEEMFQDKNRVIVRSIATGSPRGDFMGMKLDGKKSFRVMTIDIHAFEGQRVKTVHHLEEWVAAMKQLKG
jgi:predicted ester cyclase